MSQSLAEKPIFFLPLLPGFDDKFRVPIAFMEHLKEANLEKAVLTSSAGKLWPVKINGRRFEDGWKDFCRHHELIVGEFLVFRLEADLVFHVMVFGHSTCERMCPVFTIKEERTEIPPEMEEGEGPSAKQSAPDKKPNNKEQCAKGGSSVPQCPYFDVQLTTSSAKTCRLQIPVNFRRLHGLSNRHCQMTLEDEMGRFWPADLSYRESNRQAFIGRGWTTCRSANGLKAGDSLRFELVRNGKMPLIKIKKMKSNNKKQCAKGSSSVSKGPYFDAELTTYSSKQSVLHIPREFAIQHGLSNRRCKMIIEDENGRSWPTTLRYKESDHHVFIGGGWLNCRTANELRAGDSLRFELIKNGDIPSLKMSRLTAKSEATEDLNCDEAQGGSSSTRHSNSNATLKASYPRKCKLKIPKEGAKDPDSNKPEKKRHTSVEVEVCPSDSGLRSPFFAKKLPSCIAALYKLYIPMKFAKHHHLDAICSKIILIDQKARSWPAKVLYKKSFRHVFISDGWKAFVSGNEIKPGDSLVFELIGNGKRPVLKVYDVKQGTERYRQYFHGENT